MKAAPLLTMTLATALCVAPAAADVSFRKSADRVEVSIDGKPFTTLHFGPQWRKPFLHPLRAASGLEVTRRFPLTNVAGESTDHPHHRGIWWALDDINGFAFWNEPQADRPGDRRRYGRIVLKSGPEVEPGRASGKLTAEFSFVPPEMEPIGTIRHAYVFRRDGANHVIDATITLRADRGTALKLGDTEEGAFGVRLADAFRQDRGAALTNSDGLAGTENIWGKRAKWVDYSTTLEGQPVGVTLLDHPKNPKHPTYWHARGYGLCSANPFGERDFHRDPARNGSVTVPAGGSLTFRYRVVIHAGPLNRSDAERWFAEFGGG